MVADRTVYLLGLILSATLVSSYVESVAASMVGGTEDVGVKKHHSSNFVPQVAFQCGYRNMYMDRNERWVADTDQHAQCLKGKLDILKYCRRVYPNLDVTNIVESTHFYQVSEWCKPSGDAACKWTFTVKPYRCVVGEFESEALLVPQGCRFGHVDDRSVCEDFDHWNATAHTECGKKIKNTEKWRLRSFAMLEPCGLDMFSGVEFVCCPPSGGIETDLHVKVKVESEPKKKTTISTADEEDEDDDEESYDDDDEDDSEDSDEKADKKKGRKSTATSTTTTTTTAAPRATTTAQKARAAPAAAAAASVKAKKVGASAEDADDEDDDDEDDEDDDDDSDSATDNKQSSDQDPYFRSADPENEHAMYTAAVQRLEKRHREKVSKVMAEWAELEQRYAEMKRKDPRAAEKLKTEMSGRFQRTTAALGDEHREARQELDEVHQQRVMAALNEKKRTAIREYRSALAGKTVDADEALRTLQAYIRAEEKDRVHALNRYHHLLRSDPKEAAEQRQALVQRLHDIDLRVNGTIEMLKDAGLEGKLKPSIMEFWQAFRRENTPEPVADDAALRLGADVSVLLKGYEKDAAGSREQEKSEVKMVPLVPSEVKESAESAEEVVAKVQTKTVKPAAKAGVDGIDEGAAADEDEDDEDDDDDDEDSSEDGADEHANSPNQMVEEHKEPQQAHALKESLSHQAGFEETAMATSSHGGYAMIATAGVVLLVAAVIGIALIRRRYSARGQGFVEVEACTPEERHVSVMQVNGYENPTYTYFEKS